MTISQSFYLICNCQAQMLLTAFQVLFMLRIGRHFASANAHYNFRLAWAHLYVPVTVRYKVLLTLKALWYTL